MAFQVLTAAVFVAQAIGTATSAVLVAAASAGAAGLAAAASLASIAYTSYATKKAEADARKNAAQAPRDITVRSATEPAKIIYGKARTSGPVVYTNTAPTPGTNDNNTLWTVISLCSHEVEDITDIWLDGDEITASQINWGGTGGVTSGKYGPIGANEVTNFYKRLGTSTQAHVSELATAFNDWTSSYQGKNVAYIVSAFELGTATGEGVWAQGAPTNIRAVVKGKKVYDPRKDSTNGGSGAHRLADPSTWEWSDNPALCLADYLFDDRLGLGAEGVTYDDIDWPLVIAAANVCDATVSIPGGATEKRFTCNGALSTGNTYAENIKAILSSMDGQITWSGGKYRIRACAYEAPVYTFTGDDVVGDVQIQPERTRAQRFNTVRGTFVDPESDYVATEFIPYTDSNLQSGRDAGQKLTKDIALPMTNSEYMAQRLAYKIVALNDQQLRCIVPMNWKALKVGVGDRIQLSIDELSWSNKVFRVEGWAFDPDAGFNLTLQEDSSSSYADPGVSDYSTRTLAGTVVFADQPVPSPSNLSATAEEEAVFLQWANPGRASGYDEIIIYASANSSWASASEVARTRGNSFRHELARGTQRYYWIRAVDVDGETSIRNPNSDTSSITATAGQIDFANLGGATKPADNATRNTGALADLDTVDTAQIENGAVDTNQIADNAVNITKIADTLQSTNYSAGSAGWKLTTDGTFEAGNGTFRGALTATSGSIASTVTIGGTALSTVVSGAAAGATASQVNRGLALLLNQDTSGSTNPGEAGLVGVDKDGNPETGTDGFIVWNGDKITVERNQYNAFTVLTNSANKRGFIAFDVNKTAPFATTSYGDLDVAFVWKIGSQWYFDENASAGVTFNPSSFTGTQTGTDGTTTARIVALGFLETSTADLILRGGLFGEPIDLELAAFPGDVIQSGSVGGVTITDSKLYQGTGTFNNSNTGFYLDDTGKFSLKDKLAFFPSDNTLRVKGNIEADVITVNQNLQVVGDLKASSLAIASITREMFTQDALDEIYGALATAVGGSNGDYKEASGSFTTSGGTVTLALFDHGESNVVVEWLENYGFAQFTDYSGTDLQATLTFEASTTSNFATIAASKTETITLGKYDLSVYYGSTYIWYYGPRTVTKTFTTSDLADTTDYYFRVRVTNVGAAFTGITYPFEVEANEGVTGVVSTGGNADTLDNLDSTAFLRSNVDDTFDGNLVVTGNLTVNGTTVTLNTATLDVEDKNITLNYGAGDTSGSANGAGITIQDAVDSSTDASILWDGTNDTFDFSHAIDVSGVISTATASSIGIRTNYGGFAQFATDSQIDLVSSSDGTWGSAINLVEGNNTTNTDVWGIARKTTGGIGDSSLHFNFGTQNQHNNTSQFSVSSSGDGVFTGAVGGTKLNIGGTETIDTSRRLKATGASNLLDGATPSVSGDTAYFPTKMVSPKIVFLNDADGDDNYIVTNDNNNTHFVNGNLSGVWVEFYGDKTQGNAGLVYDWWKGKGAELKQFTNTGTTEGTTFLTLHNAVGGSDSTGDISQQQTFIDFVFTDNNANEYPQVRIGAQVGPDADANTTTLEGQGAFVVYTNNATGDTAGTTTGLNESFRVSYDGDATIAGALGVSGITSDTTINIDSAGHGYFIIDNGGQYESGIIYRRNGTSKWETYISTTNDDYRFYSYGGTATQLTIRDGVNGNGGTLFAGLKVTDGSVWDGSYGAVLLNSNSNYTSTSRGWMMTNAYGANRFALLYSDSATTLPALTTAGAAASGTSVALEIDNAGAVTITKGLTAKSLDLAETASTAAEIKFIDTDAAENFAIKLNGESLDFYEPEDTNKLHMRIVDDGGVNAPYGFNTGADNGTQRINADGDLVNIGYLEADDYIQLGLGTTARQNTDYLYVGGNGLDGADAAIYLGNHGGGSGYGWRLYYHGSGSGNLNDLSIQSENAGSPVNVLRFNQDGAATFANVINAEQITFDSTSGSGTGGGRVWDVKYTGDDHLAVASIDKSSGSLVIGYGAEGSTTTSNKFNSTFDNFSGKRSAVQFRSDSVQFWGTSAGVQTAVGSELTTMANTITLHTDNGAADFADNVTSEGTVQGRNLFAYAPDNGASPANTAQVLVYGYEGRGAGMFIRDSANSETNPSDREWFIGSGYGQSGFNIGYSATATQTSYAAQNVLSIDTSGNTTFEGDIVVDAHSIFVTGDGNYVTAGSAGGGKSAVMGNTQTRASGTLDYRAYFSYDTYYDEANFLWKARRTTLGRKWLQEMGYHKNEYRLRFYDGGGTGSLANGWADEDWTELLTINYVGDATYAGQVISGAKITAGNGINSASPVLLELHNYQADIDGSGASGHGNFINFKMTDANATFTPQVQIGMVVKDYSGDGGSPSEGCGNFVIKTGQGTDASGGGALTERLRVTEYGESIFSGPISAVSNSNATTTVSVSNSTAGTGARANFRLVSDAAQLDIYATSSAYSGVTSWPDAGVISTSTSASGGLILNSQAGGIKFQIAATEAARFDASGNLLVGKSVTTFNTEGFVYEAGKAVEVTTDGDRVMRLNRITNNGNILEFNRGTTTVVGAIGSEGDDSLFIQSGTTSGSGLHFHPSRESITPLRNGSRVDDEISLGEDNRRFKDLYMSGNAQVGSVSIGTTTVIDSSRNITNVVEGTFDRIGIGAAPAALPNWALLDMDAPNGSIVALAANGTAQLAISTVVSNDPKIDSMESNPLLFQMGGTEKLRVDTDGIDVSGSIASSGSIETDSYIKTSSSTSTGLIINNVSGAGAGIRFSDQTTDGSGQQGYFKFFHVNGSSYGSGAAFVASSTETLAFVVDGQVLVDSFGIKPASGTGAGTVIMNSDAEFSNVKKLTFTSANTNVEGIYLSNAHRIYGNGARALEVNGTNLQFGEGLTGAINIQADAGLQMNGATTIDANRNATFADIDVSGDIVMSGASNFLVIENSSETDAGIVFNDLQAGAWPNASSQRFMMQFNSGGESGVGSMIMGHDDDNYIGFYFQKGGSLECKGNVTAYGSTSDIRLKENVEVIPDAMDKVRKLRGVTFNYKKDGSRSTGLIAQELIEAGLPEVVYQTNDNETGEEYYAVRYGNVTGLLVQALREQDQEIAELKQLVHSLLEKINGND